MLYLHTNTAGERQILYITKGVAEHIKLYIEKKAFDEALFIDDVLSGKNKFFTSANLRDVLQDSILLG